MDVLRILLTLLMVVIPYDHLKAEPVPLSASDIDYEMVLIQPGEFDLYIPISTSFQLEYIKKKAYIRKPFEIGKYEVSNDQWNMCFNSGGCSHPALMEKGESGSHPVARVNWHDAFQFSQWLSKVTGKNYRLPTEEEWTYAVQAGAAHKAVEVNYDYSQIGKFVKRTEKRGAHPENKWGVADYEGNVWEWTLSCWYASEENILKEVSAEELNSPDACYTRIALGENRSHIPDFISDTYSGGCGTLRPAANLGFRLIREL